MKQNNLRHHEGVVYVTCLVFALVTTSIAQPAHPYVRYDFSETHQSAADHRECITQIFLSANYAGYSYREDVFGATNLTVKTIDFSNGAERKVTAKEQASLIQALIEAKVFNLQSDTKPASPNYFASVDVRETNRECRLYFYTPPNSPERKAIHDIMLGFAKRMKIDQPEDLAKVTTITEGDNQLARDVSLAEVIVHSDEYHGKRISVVGFYHDEFEGSSFSIDEAASRAHNYKRSVWRSGASTFAKETALKDKNDAWLRIDGVFLRGPRGHFGLWPGEIVRLTRIEPVSSSK